MTTSTARVLETGRDDLLLRELRGPDAPEYYALLQANAAHLTRRGDYREQVAATEQEVAAGFAEIPEVAVAFGLYLDGRLVGRADLVPVDPPRYGLGYWLAEEVTGRGLATAAVGRLLRYAREELAATDVYAGVTHGNDPSEALLRRLDFEIAADFDDYRRWHLSLDH